MRLSRRSSVGLTGLALLSLATYLLGFVLRFPLGRYAAVPLVDLGKIGGYDAQAAMWFIVPWFLLGVAYGAAAWTVSRAPAVPDVLIWVPALAFGVALIFLYPITAADLFNYVLYGLVQHAGFNPTTTSPARVLGGDLVRWSAWPNFPSPYGPVWQLLSYTITAASRTNILAGLVAFKATMLGLHLLNVWLVVRLAPKTTVAPALAGLLYGWNPFILYETVGNGHNDSLMLTWLLVALVALAGVRHGRPAALVAGAAAVLTKFVATIWYPSLLVATWRRLSGPRRAPWFALGLGLTGVASIAVMAPYGFGLDALAGLNRQASLYTTSPGATVLIATTEVLGIAPQSAIRVTLQLLAAVALAATWWVSRPFDCRVEALVTQLFDLTLVFLLVGTLWFQPWYLVPLVGLGCLAGRDRYVLAALFAIGGVASYVVYFFVWPVLGWTTARLTIQTIATSAAFGPVLLGLVLVGARARSEPRSRKPGKQPAPPRG